MIKNEEQKKEKNIKRLSVIALIISVIGLTIAFLAMSKIAKIDKNGNIKDARWNIHFENLTSNITGDAKINKMPELNEEKKYIGDFEITLTKPGDSVEFCYDVVNDGTINATLQTKLINGFDVKEISKEKIYESIYVDSDWNGDGVTTLKEVEKSNLNIPVTINMPEVLDKGMSKNACTTISFDGEELPLGNIKLKMNIQGIYIQK